MRCSQNHGDRRGVITRHARFLFVTILAAFVGACGRRDATEIPPGYLAQTVEYARQKGERATTIAIIPEDDFASLPLAFALTEFSVMFAEATGRSVVALSPESIRTWHIFRSIEVISRPAQPYRCGETLPRSVVLSDGEVAFPLAQGSMTLRGVRVTMETAYSDISFRPGARFLVFVAECRDGVFLLALGTQGAFPVTNDQQIRVNLPRNDLPTFAQELIRVGSIDEFRRRLNELKRLPQPSRSP